MKCLFVMMLSFTQKGGQFQQLDLCHYLFQNYLSAEKFPSKFWLRGALITTNFKINKVDKIHTILINERLREHKNQKHLTNNLHKRKSFLNTGDT